MEQIEKLLEMWKVDAEIDKANISEEIIKIPRLHGKYLDILSRYKILLKEIDFKYLKMKRIMFEYYTGKMDQETLEKYNLEPGEEDEATRTSGRVAPTDRHHAHAARPADPP